MDTGSGDPEIVGASRNEGRGRVRLDDIELERSGSSIPATRQVKLTSSRSADGCMTCRYTKKMKSFQNSLIPGDHIETPLNRKVLGKVSEHHAIIKSISDVTDNGKKAAVTVVDVPAKRSGALSIQSHLLNNKQQIRSSKLWKVQYRLRKYNHDQTLERAETFHQESITGNKDLVAPGYNVCIRNCEHFAAACVNGPDKLTYDNLGKSTCLQSVRCFWFIFHVLLTVAQAASYIINFYIYAIFVKKRQEYNHFTDEMTHLFRLCYKGSGIHGFDTVCDWSILSVFIVFFILVFALLICCQRRWKRSDYMCRQCVVSARIVYGVKVMCFVVFEVINIFLERWVYELIELIDTHFAFTIVFIIILSVTESIFIALVLPHYITKCCIVRPIGKGCCSICPCCCDFDEDSYKYVVRVSYI